jgi:signal transduction histidine kinase
MADPNDARTRREFLEEAAAETREPDSAMQLRTDGRDAGGGSDDGVLRDAADTLAQSGARLRDTGEALRERERELERTRELAGDLAQRAKSLRADTAQTLENARAVPTPGATDAER